jgi:hypothetical protein
MSDEARTEHLEPGSVNTRRVVMAAGGSLALLAGSIVALGLVFYAVVPANHTPTVRQFPKPRQEAHPAAELHALLARQREELNGYRWTNAEHTLIAIPIERAMQIIAARGDQAYAPLAAKQSPAKTGGQP